MPGTRHTIANYEQARDGDAFFSGIMSACWLLDTRDK